MKQRAGENCETGRTGGNDSSSIKFLGQGAVMADLASRLLDLRKTSFKPRHKNNLANEFWCYTNFDFDSIRGFKRKLTKFVACKFYGVSSSGLTTQKQRSHSADVAWTATDIVTERCNVL
ncbi:hypothetical protein NQ317_007342 [Molorchus minor]|uniref:Uncharacterized protein n=1 Tax=Molorchus minor TaxID=1323400 RepID=A0ABQ9IZB5_9CUCU|nr:hypothetical protein NQ317_007342 [Molorchus minor]